MRQLTPLLSALIMIATAGADPASACSCLPPPEPEFALGRADAVFAGRVFRIDDPRKGGTVFSTADPMVYHFKVDYVWKGPTTDTISIHTVRGESSCGFSFTPGELYIVYAHDKQGELSTGLCSRTTRFEYALYDRYWLPPPTVMPGAPQYSPITREYIIDQFGGTDPRMFRQAAEALTGTQEDWSILLNTLQAIVRGERPGNTAMAIEMLSSHGDGAERSLQEIASVAMNGDPPARAQALRALRLVLNQESCYPYLLASLTDTALEPKREAMSQLCNIGRADTFSSDALAALDKPPYVVEMFNGEESKYLFKTVTDMLTADDIFLRGNAIECLQYFRSRCDIVMPLLETVSLIDPFIPNRRHANKVIEDMKSARRPCRR